MTAYVSIDTLKAALASYTGCSPFTDARGKLRTRYKAGKVQKYTTLEPGSDAFALWFEQITTGTTAEVIQLRGGIAAKSFGHAWQLLRDMPEWRDLDPKTHSIQEPMIAAFLAAEVDPASTLLWRDVPVADASRKHLKRAVTTATDILLAYRRQCHARLAGIDPARAEREAHKLRPFKDAPRVMRMVVRKLVDVALDDEWMEGDPMSRIELADRGPSSWKPWTEAQMIAFEEAYAYGTQARTVYELAKWLGVRRSDIATIAWEQYGPQVLEGGEVRFGFTFVQQKGRNQAGATEQFQPMTEELMLALAHLTDRRGTVLKTIHGTPRPYKIETLSSEMKRWTRAIGLTGCILHGIRHSMGEDQAMSGSNLQESMAGMNHKTPTNSLKYTRRYQQAVGAVKSRDKVVELRRTRRAAFKQAG